MKSLYFHFPFCESKCHYCDFYSLGRERTQATDADDFERAILKEVDWVRSELNGAEIDTLFFGGGTPSMTPPRVMQKLMESVWKSARPTSQMEWTMEANPSSIDLDRMKDYRSLGVNRISMGVQSLRDDHLKLLGRVHNSEGAFRALEAITNAGFTDLSCDLLCGVPGQTVNDLRVAIDQLTQFPLTHLSCYILTLPKHHPLFGQLPSEEIQLEHYLFVDQYMKEKGFEHYEISNFARRGKQARHNLHYWTGTSYLGLGPSAHSFNSNTSERWKNVSSLRKYAQLLDQGKSPREGLEKLTEEQKELERWMLRLRLADGFPSEWLNTPKRKQFAQRFLADGLMERHSSRPEYLRLTPRGMAVSDTLIRAFA